MELKDIKGLGPSRIRSLNDRGIYKPQDLLNTFPNKYLDFSNIDEYSRVEGAMFTLKGKLVEAAKCVYFKGLNYTIATFCCARNGKKFKAVWYGQSYMKNNLCEGKSYYIIGKQNKKRQIVVQNHYEISKVNNELIPIYGASAGLSCSLFTTFVKAILDSGENFSLLEENSLQPLMEAYREIHFPTTIANLSAAKERIALEDLMLLASLEETIHNNQTEKGRKYDEGLLEEFKKITPFELTADQCSALEDVCGDMRKSVPMNRLVVGDVGSGKTMVALGAAFIALRSGYQVIFVCPTEILAKQHYNTAKSLFKNSGIKTELLIGSLKQKEKKETVEKINSGEAELVIATHAALSKDICPPNLALVITDEQHRFGVNHRAILAAKGNGVDSLVMSATPIPRSLALVLFGGLECSTIHSRPSGESKIETKIVPMEKEEKMWRFIKTEITENGGKCFVVAPRIEEGNSEEISSVFDIQKKLSAEYGYDGVAKVVHGKMNKEEVDTIIEEFILGNISVLISTTIIEVGIDVKSANLMVIYNAERFGLATLHQLRGRVGRDGREGFCFCLTNVAGEQSMARLKKFKEIKDGITLAEEDLKLRGAGTMYGTKQHGTSELFLNLNFSIDEYNKAKKIYKKLSIEQKEKLQVVAEEKFGDIYKKVVLN